MKSIFKIFKFKSMPQSILLDERTDRSELQLLQLKERRQESFTLLEALRIALDNLLGEPSVLHQIERFIKIQNEKDATIEALKVYMQVKKIDLHIDLNTGFQSVRLPGEVSMLVEAWQAVHWHSPEDFRRYWSHEHFAFQQLPIEPEEEKQIRERNCVYGTNELNEMYNSLRVQVNLMNLYRGKGMSIPFDYYPKVWNSFIETDGTGKKHVKEEAFLTPGEPYQAFDEK